MPEDFESEIACRAFQVGDTQVRVWSLFSRVWASQPHEKTEQESREEDRLFAAFFMQNDPKLGGDPPEFFTAAQIARACGMNIGQAGRLLEKITGVQSVPGKGYRSDDVYRRINELFRSRGHPGR